MGQGSLGVKLEGRAGGAGGEGDSRKVRAGLSQLHPAGGLQGYKIVCGEKSGCLNLAFRQGSSSWSGHLVSEESGRASPSGDIPVGT